MEREHRANPRAAHARTARHPRVARRCEGGTLSISGGPDPLFGEIARQRHLILLPCLFVISVLIASLCGSLNRPSGAEIPGPERPPKPVTPGNPARAMSRRLRSKAGSSGDGSRLNGREGRSCGRLV